MPLIPAPPMPTKWMRLDLVHQRASSMQRSATVARGLGLAEGARLARHLEQRRAVHRTHERRESFG
jgi:hypothetical protein